MSEQYNLTRFIDAQKNSYSMALAEIHTGKKSSHWMWYIFPQIQGLGHSDTSQFYALKDLGEAEAYLQHPVLGKRLLEITQVLLQLNHTDAHEIFGSPDDLKLKSSMTLFAAIRNANLLFQSVLDKYFGGRPDIKTLSIIQDLL